MKQERLESPQSRSQASQRLHLRLVQPQRPGLALQTAQTKDGRTLINAHQAAPHQSLQSGRRQLLAPQPGQRQLAAARRQLRQNRLLLRGQRGQPRFRNQNSKPLHASRIALSSSRLARNPLLARKPGQHRQRRRGRRAQRGNLHRLARSQTRQHTPLHVLLLGRELPLAL